jgi:branched-chain amino acid transport system permease protein
MAMIGRRGNCGHIEKCKAALQLCTTGSSVSGHHGRGANAHTHSQRRPSFERCSSLLGLAEFCKNAYLLRSSVHRRDATVGMQYHSPPPWDLTHTHRLRSRVELAASAHHLRPASKGGVSMQDLVNIVVLGSLYFVFAIGLSLVWGSIGILNFAHGAIFVFSAFVGSLIVNVVPLPFVATVLLCMIAGSLLSLFVQRFAYEVILARTRDVRVAEFQILIGGIGVTAALVAIIHEVTRTAPFGFYNSTFRIDVYEIAGARISNIQILIVVTGVIVGGGTAWWMRKSKSGLALRAIGVDPETASLMGINRTRLARSIMALAGAYAGLAGALLTYHLGSIVGESGDSLIVKAFAVIILGGVGSILGVAIGALILGTAETLVLTHTASGSWVDAISFGLIFLVLLVRPQGLFGRAEVRRT